MTTFKDFSAKIPVDTDEAAGFQAPGNPGDDRRFTFLNIFNYIRAKLGTAAVKDTVQNLEDVLKLLL